MSESPCWWQWPTILSLDAPAVSLLWQALLARVAAVPLRWPQVSVLGASVWLAYAADRWIEGRRLDWRDVRTQRLHFYQRRRRPVAMIWLVIFAADVGVAFTQLSWRELASGALLLALVLVYLLSHQLVHRHLRWRVPKELCVAALLTGGVWLFLMPTRQASDLTTAMVLFALLCFTNCALISRWERDVDLAHGQRSLALDASENAWVIRQFPLMIAVLAVAVSAANDPPLRVAGACALASAMLLAVVDQFEPRMGWRAARVLADVVLMTPAIALLWIK